MQTVKADFQTLFTWGGICYFAGVVAMLCGLGCSAAGDDSNVTRMIVSTPASFTPEQVAVVEDARDQWCAANGWCPAVMVGGTVGKRIELVDTVAEPAPGGAAVGAHTDVENQEIQLQRWAYEDAGDRLWIIIAHEMGHLQHIPHHGGPECTMFWEHSDPVFELTCER